MLRLWVVVSKMVIQCYILSALVCLGLKKNLTSIEFYFTNCIMITRLCYLYPLTPHFYIVNLGFTGVYFFLMFVLKQRLWVLIRTVPVRRFSHAPTVYVLSEYGEKEEKKQLKKFIFTAIKICSILHKHVIVMASRPGLSHM